MGRPKKISAEDMLTNGTTGEIQVDENENVITPREAFEYPVPETKEDFLALHKCLKDTGINSTGDLEVRASKL